MSNAVTGSVDPLLRAIAEFRDEVNRLFDEQVTRLSARTGDIAPRVSVPAAPEPTEESPGRAPDPRPRLDALAKHLDLRRRLGTGSPVAERTE